MKTKGKKVISGLRKNKEVAIIGVGLRFPGSNSLEEYWDNLVSGRCSITEVPLRRWDKEKYYGDTRKEENKTNCIWGGFIDDADCFDPSFFKISPREAELMDPQQRIALELAWKAIEDAGYRSGSLKSSKTGVYMAVTNTDYTEMIEKDLREVDAFINTGNSNAVIANRISFQFDFTGPSITVDTACAGSLVAIHQAVRALENDECEFALAGGVNLCWSPRRFISLSQSGSLSKSGVCKAFDDDANGYVRAEGGAVILLKPLLKAIEDNDHIYAIIRGSGTNHGGRTNSLTVTNPNAHAQLIRDVYERAGVGPDTVSYIEAHGVGTPLGDAMEIHGLKTAFSQMYKNSGEAPQRHFCGIGSVKSNIGHAEAAAGMAGVLKVIASMKHGTLPASINIDRLNTLIKLDDTPFYIVRETKPWDQDAGASLPRRAGVSAFGFGGGNAHVLLEEYIPPERLKRASEVFASTASPIIVPLSAKKPERLKEYASLLSVFIKRSITGETDKAELESVITLPDMAYTLQTGRDAMEERVIFAVKDFRELTERLDAFAQGREDIPGCWRGLAGLDKTSSEAGNDQEKLLETMRRLVDEKKIDEIAAEWVKGAPFDWNLLYGDLKPDRISLPTYPFARERYWLPEPSTPALDAEAGSITPVIHPLLHRNTSDFTTQRFCSNFTGAEFFLSDHQVKGRRILPAVACLEMVREAVEQAAGVTADNRSGIRLKNSVWLRPVISGDKPVKVIVELFLKENGEIAWELSSHTEGDDAEPVQNARGKVSISPAVEAPVQDIEALRARCNKGEFSSVQCYEAFKGMGFEYGPGHQGIETVYVGADLALAKLNLPLSLADTSDRFILHPSLTDSAFQASLGLMMGFGNLTPVIPFSLESVEIFSVCSPSIWAWIRYGNKSGATDKAQKFDIDLCDEHGAVCVKFAGLSFRAVEDETKSEASVRPVTVPATSNSALEINADVLLDKILAYLVPEVSKLLKVSSDDLDVETELNDYGFGSITYTEFADIISEAFKLELAPTIFFEYTTLLAVAQYLVSEYREELAKRFDVRNDSASLQTPSEPEVTAIPIQSASGRFSERFAQPALSATAESEPIAIVGMSGAFPMARNVDEFWKNLADGRDCVTEIPESRWDWQEYFGDPAKEGNRTNVKWGGVIDEADLFDPLFFGISPKEAESMDPQQRLLMTYVWKVVEDAGYSPQSLSGTRTGIFVGTMNSGYVELMTQADVALGGYSVTGVLPSVGPNRMSFYLNIHGASEPIETACSSSLVAIHRAVNAINNGSCDMAVVGGINLFVSPEFHVGLSKAGMLSADGRCKTFSDKANGYVRGEGVGMLFLKRLKDAEEDGAHIYGLIKGTAENHGGRAASLTAPNPKAQADLLVTAYKKAGIDPRTVGYIEAHGTGTELGDPIEINGLKAAFKELYQEAGETGLPSPHCGLGSVKTNIGHLELAAGIAGVFKVLMQLKHKSLVKTLHCDTVNPYIQLNESPFYLVRETREWKSPVDAAGNILPRRAGVSSFGMGGVNAHVVIEEYIPKSQHFKPDADRMKPAIILLSAKSEEQLRKQARQLADHLRDRRFSDSDLADIAYTLQVGREAMDERLAVIAGSIDELQEKLNGFAEGRKAVEGIHRGQARRDKESVSVLAADEDIAKAIDAWINKGKYQKLLDLWVKGLNCDWNKLYGDEKPHRVNLPTYPFAAERYWVPLNKAGTGKNRLPAQTAFLHPLLHQNTSDFSEQRFSSIFTGQEFFLEDHVVKSRRVLPAVAYLEMARAAVERATGSLIEGEALIRLKNVVWTRIVAVEDKPANIHIGLSPEENGGISYEIYSETDDGVVVVHSQGSAVISSLGQLPGLDTAALRERCRERIFSSADCNKLFLEMGFELGPAFRGVDEVYVGQGEALARLSLPPSVYHAGGRFNLHPGLMDSALQASTGLTVGPGKPSLRLPFALEELEILGESAPVMWAFIRYSAGYGAKDKIQKLDIDLCDEAGTIRVRMKGFSTRVYEGESASTPDIGALMFRPVWKERAVDHHAKSPSRPKHVVLLCGLDDVSPESLESRMNGVRCLALRSLKSGIGEQFEESLLAAIEEIQSILKEKGKGETLIQLAVPNRGEQRLFSGISGLLKTAQLENPLIATQVVEVEPGEDSADIAAKLAEECANPLEAHVRYQSGKRYVAALSEVETTTDNAAIPWKDNGIYLITGGTGGLGLIFAEEIAGRVKEATLILTGRASLSDEKRARLKALEELGARIEYRQVDVTKAEEVSDLIQSIRAEFGGLNGIIHSAGVLRDSFIIRKTAEELSDVLGPKVTGLVNLDEASRETPLDFFIFFSSLAALGNVGQADYAAANAFMDAYAGYRNDLVAEGRRRGRTLSINWPLWKEGGMHVDEETEKMMRQNKGLIPMNTKTGINSLYQALAGVNDQVIVMEGDIKRVRTLFIEQPLPEQPALPPPVQEEIRIKPAIAPDQHLERAVNFFKNLLSSIIKLPAHRIDADAPMEKYGIDSLMVIQLTNQLEKTFGSLSKTLFFEYQNIRDLAGYFLESFGDRLSELLGIDEKAASTVQEAKPSEATPEPDKPVNAVRMRPRFSFNHRVGDVDEKNRRSNDIAIIGVSGRYPQSRNLDEFWNNLRDGKDCVTEIPKDRWDHSLYYDENLYVPGKTHCKWGGFMEGIDQFDPLFFNISPRDAEIMEPQERLFMEIVWELLENIGQTRESLHRQHEGKIGMYVGAMFQMYKLFDSDIGKESSSSVTSYSFIANRTSHFFNFQGPSMAVDTMCSSSTHAIHLACESLLSGESKLAIAGGVNLSIHPKKYIGLTHNKLVGSHIYCRSFCDGNGYIPCEGVGAVLLKPLADAVADGDNILAVIKSTSANNGGHTNGFTVPNPSAQLKLMEDNFKKSGIDPRTISFVEAAANGSALGDPIEINGLNKIFKKLNVPRHSCPIGSVKSNMGHAEAVSGIVGLTKVIMQLQHRELVPTIMADVLNPNIDFDDTPFFLLKEGREWKRPVVTIDGKTEEVPRRATINSLGAGGSNVHIIVEEYVPPQEAVPVHVASANQPQIIVFSAKNPDRLKAVVSQLYDFVETRPDISLPDLAYTLQVGREAMECRMAMVVNDLDELVQGMKRWLDSSDENPDTESFSAIFTGYPEGDGSEFKSLLTGKLGESLLQALQGERNPDQLALFWAKGGNVPWKTVREKERRKIISLPTYPFDRRRYWFEPADKGLISKAVINTPEVNIVANSPVSGDLGRQIRIRIGEQLSIVPEELPVRKPLYELGFNSMQSVTLRFMFEKDYNAEIPTALVNENMTIEAIERNLRRIIDQKEAGEPKADQLKTIGQHGNGSPIQPVSPEILPSVIPDIPNRYQPFPLNDIQESFLAGRMLRIGGDWVGCHIYFEMETENADIYRLNKAWNALVEHHEMLHCIIMSDGRQRILENAPPYRFKVADLRRKSQSEQNDYLRDVRNNLSHKVYEPEQWPLFEISVSVCPDNRYVIHFSVDELIIDASGVFLLLQQWQRLYENPEWKLPELSLSFRDYLTAVKKFEDSRRYKRDMEYWTDRLENMPGGPVSALRQQTGRAVNREYFCRTRLNGILNAQLWDALKKKARQLNASPTALLLSMFTEFLRHWSEEETFSLILTFYNRLPLHEQLDQVVGPFISTNLFVVEKPEGRSFEELLERNQERLWNDLDHSGVSGISVLRELKARRKITGSLFLPVVFTSMLNNFEAADSAKAETFFDRISYMVTQTPQVYLDHQVFERNGELRFSWDVAEEYFGHDAVNEMFAGYCRFLHLLASDNDLWETKSLQVAVNSGKSVTSEETYSVETEFRNAEVLPEGLTLNASPADKFKPFALTDQQQAYAFGRSKYSEGGNFGCQVYEEIEVEGLDLQRLENGLRNLIISHEMLVTVIGSDGMQKIMQDVPEFKVKVTDLTGKNPEELHAELKSIRESMVNHIFSLDGWPYFDLRVSVLDNGLSRIHFCIDMLIADANSIHLLLKQLYHFYENPGKKPENCGILFRDYIMSLQSYKKTEGYRKSLQYWENKFTGIPSGPRLPMMRSDDQRAGNEHEQFNYVLKGWAGLKEKARHLSVSPAMILLTAYAEVLASRVDQMPFSIVIPSWERLPLHPAIYDLVGDFTALSWVVVTENSLSFEEKVRLNHETVQKDLSHMAVSGLKALRKAIMRGGRKDMLSFPVVFTNLMTHPIPQAPKGFRTVEMMSKTPQVYLDNISEEDGETLHLRWDVVKEVFPHGMIEDMFSGYTRLLEALTAESWELHNPSQPPLILRGGELHSPS